MSVQLSMFSLMMSEASPNATGSRDLGAGAKPCVSPDGLMIGASGQDRRLASPSAPQGSSVAAPTNVTSPLTSPSSSPATAPPTSSESKSPARLCSESLQKALEARLQANLSGLGSMIYSGAWKPHTTPAGRQIYRLRASARRTSVSEPSLLESGWPTPASRDGKGGYLGGRIRDGKISTDTLDVTAQMAGWPTPHTNSTTGPGSDGRAGGLNIQTAAHLAGWATPVGQQANGTPERFLERKRESMERGSQSMGISLSDLNMQAQAWTGWTTPQAHDTSGRSLGQKAIHGTKHGCACLVRDAAIAGWKTPCTPNGGRSMSTERMDATGRTLDGKKHTASLEHEVKFSSWPTPTALERNADPETMQKRRDFRKENANQNTVPMYLNEAAQITTDAEMCEAMGYPVTLEGPARLLADGTILTGSSAEMESGGQLNPRFSGWLMGYPTEWCEAAISCQLATPSRKKVKPTPGAP